jgi:Sigma-70 region 2
MGDLDDPAAFRALFEAHFSEVHRYLAHRLGDAGAAEDLAAETFLRAYAARGRFRTGNTTRTSSPATARLVAEGTSDGRGSVRWNNLYAMESARVAKVGLRP